MKYLYKLILLIFYVNIYSHEFNPAHLIINESQINKNSYEVTWLYPVKNIGTRAEVTFPESCSIQNMNPFVDGKYIVEKILLNCELSLKGKSIEIINLSVLTDALISINYADSLSFEALATNKEPVIKIPEEQTYYPTAYIFLGIDHLLNGIDHILFILGLIFLVKGMWNIIKTITAFTIAHSITLGLTVLNIINLPEATVEILIALTIVYLALEINDSDKIKHTPWALAFIFGLLHGMGFAGALTDIGITNENIFLSLLFFNIGIELGQLILIPIFSFIIWTIYRLNYYKTIASTVSYVIGSMGIYWVIVRFTGLFI